MQQAVGIEGVPDAAAPFALELETHLGAALADGLADLGLLLGRGAVLFGQVFAGVLAFGAHVGVEFEGLEVDVGRDFGAQLAQSLLQGAQAHGAPRAGDIGDEIDFE